MFEIYTPKAWHAFFPEPQIIIDDDGLIYNKKDYDKIIRGSPIGMISFDKGYIYGRDYNAIINTPIGKYEKKKYYDCIYGPDYDKLLAEPILYIENNIIYTPNEFTSFKLRPRDPSGYIKNTTKNKKQEEQVQNKEPVRWEDRKAEDEKKFSMIKIIGIGLAILFCIAFYVGVIGDIASGDSTSITIVLISLASCILVSLFANKWIIIALVGALISAITFMFFRDIDDGFILNALAGCLMTFPLGGIVWFIRKTVDQHFKKGTSILASIPYLIGGTVTLIAIIIGIISMFNNSANTDIGVYPETENNYTNTEETPDLNYGKISDNQSVASNNESDVPSQSSYHNEDVDSGYMSSEDIENNVSIIREKYNLIEGADNLEAYTSETGVIYYYRQGELVKVYVPSEVAGDFNYFYYYDNGDAFFVYREQIYEGQLTSYRLYFVDGRPIRVITGGNNYPNDAIIDDAPSGKFEAIYNGAMRYYENQP